MQKRIGLILALFGSALSMLGALVNNLLLDHYTAMLLWMLSNPAFAAYFIGVDRRWWNGQHIGTRALILTYAAFTISNLYGLWIMSAAGA